jgi:hypothetical protein
LRAFFARAARSGSRIGAMMIDSRKSLPNGGSRGALVQKAGRDSEPAFRVVPSQMVYDGPRRAQVRLGNDP